MKLDELDFLSIWNLIFAGYTGSKNQIRNRQKIKLIKLDFLNLIFQKSSADLYGENLFMVNNKLMQ